MPVFRWGASYDPWAGLRWLQREMRQLTDDARPITGGRHVGGGNYPPVNVYNGEDEMIVMAEVPGVPLGDLDLSITAETLVIRGTKNPTADEEAVRFQRRERGSGQFDRTIILPDKVDAEAVTAKLTHGVLTITLPKSEAAKPKQITVQG